MTDQKPSSAEITDSDPILSHDSLNPNGKSTIIFIHGAFSSRREWNMVIPFIPDTYHILVPDLPAHAESRDVKPFSTQYSARLLAKLINEKAIDGVAHVVGLSLGAHVAIGLASGFPDRVKSTFVSGFEVYPGATISTIFPYAMWTMNRIQDSVPRSVVNWLMDGADIQSGNESSSTLDLCTQVGNSMTTKNSKTPSDTEAEDGIWPPPWPSRTLIVAAGKRGILPSHDHPHDAIRLAKIGQSLNPETVAMTHLEMRHPWNRQAPELFAQTAIAWIEEREIPAGFKKL